MNAPTEKLNTPVETIRGYHDELRTLRRVRVWKDRLQIFDINKDYFEVRGVGYADADVAPLLRAVNTAFNPETLHDPIDAEYKEFDTGRRYPWAQDRVM